MIYLKKIQKKGKEVGKGEIFTVLGGWCIILEKKGWGVKYYLLGKMY